MTRVADKQREKRMRKKRQSSNATTLAQKRQWVSDGAGYRVGVFF
jgi:hypothetical protein